MLRLKKKLASEDEVCHDIISGNTTFIIDRSFFSVRLYLVAAR